MYMCALHDLVPPTVWNASLDKWRRLKQSIQLVQAPLSINKATYVSLVLHHSQNRVGCWKRQNADTAREGKLTSALLPISRVNNCSLS